MAPREINDRSILFRRLAISRRNGVPKDRGIRVRLRSTLFTFLFVLQVVTLSLYAYFFSALLGRQFIERTDVGGGKYEEPDMYFPFFTALQVRKP